MRVRRSLTIKQMAMVAGVSAAFIFLFTLILLFHFTQQDRYTTAMQMESVARAVRPSLSSAILRADLPEAEQVLRQIQPAGMIARADVVLPNQFQALRVSFAPERSVPQFIARLFELPLQITLPIYSTVRTGSPQPIAYLVLQADTQPAYRRIVSTISTLITTWLLLSLVITVALTWCINRLMVHPLRKIARELSELPVQTDPGHQLPLARFHRDDEIGMLVRAYNLNQQIQAQRQAALNAQATHDPATGLANKVLLMAQLQQYLACGEAGVLLVISCDTLDDEAKMLSDAQRDVLVLALSQRLSAALPGDMLVGRLGPATFGAVGRGNWSKEQAQALASQLLSWLNERLQIQTLQLLPVNSIGIALAEPEPGLTAEQLYQRAESACRQSRQLNDRRPCCWPLH